MDKRKPAVLLISAILVAASFAQEAEFTEVIGKVEYQNADSGWIPARAGSKISKGTVISTGFKSEATIAMGTTTITLKPVTRLTLEEHISSQTETQTQLFLLTGRVRADVPPQAERTTSFRIKSATATASVRGTGFEFDGVNLIVDRGSVQLRTPGGQNRAVRAGEFSYVTPGGTVPPAVVVAMDSRLDRIGELVAQSDTILSADPVSPAGISNRPLEIPRVTVELQIQ